jgi:hypothetical protein
LAAAGAAVGAVPASTALRAGTFAGARAGSRRALQNQQLQQQEQERQQALVAAAAAAAGGAGGGAAGGAGGPSSPTAANAGQRLRAALMSPAAGGPGALGGPGGGARALERAVSHIAVPAARELPPLELAARRAAMHRWRPPRGGGGGGSVGGLYGRAPAAAGANAARATARQRSMQELGPPPAEVRAALESARADGEGSSEEDTSDEAYAALHAPMEREEHVRLGTGVGGAVGGARRRGGNKPAKPASSKEGSAGTGGGRK